MIIFETKSGSVYSVDTETQTIKRLNDDGRKDHAASHGNVYVGITDIRPGQHVLVEWPDGKTMWTTTVVEVHQEPAL